MCQLNTHTRNYVHNDLIDMIMIFYNWDTTDKNPQNIYYMYDYDVVTEICVLIVSQGRHQNYWFREKIDKNIKN